MAADNRMQRVVDADGATLDIFPLPDDEASLEELLRDLFERHWDKITFGPLIQGAAWEIRAPHAPTHVGMLDGCLTVAFGASHFHLCIGPHKGSPGNPTPEPLARHRRTARAELYRRLDKSGVPVSWGARLFNGQNEQQTTVLLPNPFLSPDSDKVLEIPDWSRLICGTGFGRGGSVSRNPTRSTAQVAGSVTDKPQSALSTRRNTMLRQDSSLAPQARRHLLWISSLVVASLVLSLGLACATPLAAFAAVAALTSSRREGLILILSVWFANQLVGFTMLGYPWAASTFAWGLALGAAAILAVLAGQWTASRLVDAARAVSFLATGLAAFAAYEAALFVVAVTWLGGAEDFTAAILGRIFLINAAAFVGLLVLHRTPLFARLPADRLIPLGITAPRA